MQKKVLNYLSLLLFVGLLIFVSSTYQYNPESAEKTSIHFLDVGQGDSALVEMPNNAQILIDAGPGRDVLEEVGNLMPYYDRKIEYLILSHPHADHFAGFNYIVDRYEVEKIYLNGYENNTPDYELLKKKIIENNIPIEILKRGDSVNFGNVNIDVLWPQGGKTTLTDINDSSLIFYLRKENDNILFTGDASASVQELINYDYAEVDILKVSHHGARTGASAKLIDKLKPQYSIFSVGENNRFKHPSQIVINLLRDSLILRTDLGGTISFELTGAGVTLK